MTRLRVVQRRELLDASPADRVDDAFAQPAVQVAHELGIRLGELPKRAVQELDAHTALVLAVGRLDRRLEAQTGELGLERAEAATRARAPTGLDTPDPAGAGRVERVGAHALREG